MYPLAIYPRVSMGGEGLRDVRGRHSVVEEYINIRPLLSLNYIYMRDIAS